MNKEKRQREGKQPAGPAELLPGMKDRLPGVAASWEAALAALERVATDDGFVRIETPVLESTSLFAPFGESMQEMIETFSDAEGQQISFRPDLTLGLARAYREHNLGAQQPFKCFAVGPVLRRERPSAGRLRTFTQVSFEVFGDGHPIVEAQLIASLMFAFQELGLAFEVHVNSMGHEECRKKYERALMDFFRPRRGELCPSCIEDVGESPIRVLQCAVPGCQTAAHDAPQIIDHLCDDDRQHFAQVLEYLDDVDVTYLLDPRLFREKDFYNRTIVEFFPTHTGTHLALAGGGRYDTLLARIGGQPTPAFGIACGMERIVLALQEQSVPLPKPAPPDVFLAQIGDEARTVALKLLFQLRSAGIKTAESLVSMAMKTQLEMATKLGVQYSLIIGKKEILDGTILIRDMENGIQEIAVFEKIIPEMKKRLKKNGTQ